jgi:hypothetical protein
MPRPGGALNRSLQALTIGVVKGVQAREKALSRTTLGDLVQHQQLDIAGYIGKDPHTYVFSVGWDIPFVYAPMQHDSDLERPHFNYGVELGQQPTTPGCRPRLRPTTRLLCARSSDGTTTTTASL